jgi:hypothetical protein
MLGRVLRMVSASRGSVEASVELGSDGVEVGLGERAQAGALREVLAHNSPFVFSLEPRCQGLCGSQK